MTSAIMNPVALPVGPTKIAEKRAEVEAAGIMLPPDMDDETFVQAVRPRAPPSRARQGDGGDPRRQLPAQPGSGGGAWIAFNRDPGAAPRGRNREGRGRRSPGVSRPRPMNAPVNATDPLVLFMPSGKRGRFPVGTAVLDAARQLGVYVESVCGGRATCGRCQIEVQEGNFAKHQIVSSNDHISPRGAKEERYDRVRGLPERRRLSCSAQILGDLVVDVPQDTVVNAQVVRKAASDRVIERNAAVQLCYVEVDEPDMHKPLGDLDRLKVALERDWGWKDMLVAPHLIPQVQKILRTKLPDQPETEPGHWGVTAAIHRDMESARPFIIGLWPGLKNEAYGIACDIGSTTIAMHLVSLLSGRIVASSGTSNPQIRFGEDLMSRVSYVMMNPDGREAMTKAVREAVNELIGKVCAEGGIDRHDILDMVFVGNPIMHHLFLGIDPTELGQAPFALAVSGALQFWAHEIDIDVNRGARLYLLPCIAGHVGADAAGATLSEGPYRQDRMMLLVDVGTNAEIVLGNSTRVVAASSPTGPAFEGAEISSGQRAAPGAIERVRIDPETLEPQYRVIGTDKWSDEAGFDEESLRRPASPASAARRSSRSSPKCICPASSRRTASSTARCPPAARASSRTAAPGPICCARDARASRASP